MNTKFSMPSVDELLSLSSPRDIGESLSITKMMLDIQDFGLNTFDCLDVDGNGFISRKELECALTESEFNSRQVIYVRFMLANLEKISWAVDDGDGISPCGISRADIIKGISRSDLVRFFCSYIK
jgi:hypothetical protein